MIENPTAINGILAAVISANFVPLHAERAGAKAALARKPLAKKHEKAEASKRGAGGGAAPFVR
jgi:hypothetical protein